MGSLAFTRLVSGRSVEDTVALPVPKADQPDNDITGISAVDFGRILVTLMETKLRELDGPKSMIGTASTDSGGAFSVFGWDIPATIADYRDKIDLAEVTFPNGAEQSIIDGIDLSEFSIVLASLSG